MDHQHIDTGIGAQLQARDDYHQQKVRAGKARAASRAKATQPTAEDNPFE